MTQESIDRFYRAHGPCCAGCDWWRWMNSMVGDCTRRAPVGAKRRWSMLGIEGSSLAPAAGHVVTARDHVCGDFKDDFDWSSTPGP